MPLKKHKDRTRRITDYWVAIENEMASFEPGRVAVRYGIGSGFFRLPSGRPMAQKTVVEKFGKIAAWAQRAHELAAQPESADE